MLLAVPNVASADPGAVEAIADAFASGGEVLDVHTDVHHERSVFTLGGAAGALARGVEASARACLERIDVSAHAGAHPTIGALDVCPVVHLAGADRDAAREEALAAAEAIAALGIPAFLYGELASAPEQRERAYFRSGGLAALAQRMRDGELRPDLGPPAPHPSAGATLLTARPPLAAFNLLLDTGDVEVARAVAAELREAGGGLPGVRALGIDLGGRAQVSTNVHDPITVPLATVIERVRELAAPLGAQPLAGEIVGLVPEAALRGLPADPPLEGFDPDRHLIERRLCSR